MTRGYLITLGLNNNEKPLQWAFDGSRIDFLRNLEKQLRACRLNGIDYSTGYRIYPKQIEVIIEDILTKHAPPVELAEHPEHNYTYEDATLHLNGHTYDPETLTIKL